MFTRFSVQNYRNITANDVPLKRVNLLIGPNNCGKTNFLRSFVFFQNVLAEDVPTAVVRHEGASMRRRGVPSDTPVRWRWNVRGSSSPARQIDTSVHLSVKIPDQDRVPADVRVNEEWVGVRHVEWDTSNAGKLLASIPFAKPTYTVIGSPGLELSKDFELMKSPLYGLVDFSPYQDGSATFTALQAMENIGKRKPNPSDLVDSLGMDDSSATDLQKSAALVAVAESFRRDLRLWRQPLVNHVQMAKPIQMRSGVAHLAQDASDIANLLRHIDQEHPEGIVPYHDALSELMPEFRRVVIREGGDFRWLEIQNNGDRISLRDVSDGTRNVMVLAALLFNEKKDQILCIDEPELNLHPAWLRIIGRWFQRAPSLQQCFLSTHSPDLLDTFTEGFREGDVGVLVFNTKGEVRAAAPEQLDSFFKQGWALGDLYRVGEPQLGGWP